MENQIREISLRYLFWKVMLRWKLWVVCALLCAILLPGVKYAKDIQVYKMTQQSQDNAQKTVFSQEEQQQIDNLRRLLILLDKSNTYMQNSILMHIDPYQENVLKMQYYVDSEYTYNLAGNNKSDYSSAITDAYVDYISNGLDQGKIWNNVVDKVDDKYYAELFLAESGDSDNTFSVTVKYTDSSYLSNVSAEVQKALSAKHDNIAETIGNHKLVLISENYEVQTDTDLANSQNTVANLIKSYRDQITAMRSTMTEAQLGAVDSEVSGESDEETSIVTNVATPVFSKKYIVLGFVMGAFLAVLYLICVAVLSNKLQDAEELVQFYSLRQFGILTQVKGSKGLTGLLLRVKYRNQKILSADALVQLVISNIELYCKNEGITKLLLTGSEIEHVEKATITKIMEELGAKGIHVVYGENICYNSAAMREASRGDHVVLVEITDVSIYQEIEKELRMLKDWNVDVIGYIGVE